MQRMQVSLNQTKGVPTLNPGASSAFGGGSSWGFGQQPSGFSFGQANRSTGFSFGTTTSTGGSVWSWSSKKS